MITQDRVIECEQEMMKAFMSFASRSENDYDLYKELIKPVLKLSNDVRKEEENFKSDMITVLANYTRYLLKNKITEFMKYDTNDEDSSINLDSYILHTATEYIEGNE